MGTGAAIGTPPLPLSISWEAILPNSNPVPLGSFTVDASGVASFTSKQGPVGPGMAVAVSREPQAGATAPTEVVSVGVASTPAS